MNEARMTNCAIKAKHWVLRHYLWVTLALLVLALAVGFWLEFKTWKKWAAIIGVPVAFLVASQKQKTEELELFKRLFKEFNERYDAMNEKLYSILDKRGDAPLEPDDRNLLFDYFNLCGEEYLFYRQGYIYPEVWKAWHNGMKIFRDKRWIKKLWDQELKTDSYYGLAFKDEETAKHDELTYTCENDDKIADESDSRLCDAA